jgi:hypothetical protein
VTVRNRRWQERWPGDLYAKLIIVGEDDGGIA